MPNNSTGPARRTGNAWIERLSRRELDRFVERAVLRKVADAGRNAPLYRWYYAKHGIRVENLKTLAEFREVVPPIAKPDILAFQNEGGVRIDDPRNRQFHLTSGTSGVGHELHPRTQSDIAALGTGGAYEFYWAGLVQGDRVLLTMPYSQTMAGPHFHMACEASGLVPINAFFTARTEERIQQLYRFECNGLIATPSYVHRMTLVARAAGRNPAADLPSLRAIVVSGESYGMEWATETAAFWGATLYEGWGATQTLGVVMATCEAGGVPVNASGTPRRGVMHGFDHRCFIEVLEPGTLRPVAPGEVGEIVVTTLRTKGLPSIRFRMGDRVRLLPHGTCGCGRPFSSYEAGTISRLDDMIKIRGMNVWPSAIDAVVFAGPVADYSGRIYTDDRGRESVELLVEPSVAIADAGSFVADLAERIKRHVGVNVDISLIALGSLSEVQFKARRWRDERAVLAGGRGSPAQ